MDSRPLIYAGADSVIVRLAAGGRLVRVIVTREALETRFAAGHSPEGWVEAYRANAQEIEAVIRGKVARACPEPVLVSKHDFGAPANSPMPSGPQPAYTEQRKAALAA